jgi:glycosyltransferase involved in cell wall biosynthesis
MTASLRFCLVTTFYPPYHFGGDGVFVHRLAGALAARGHHVDVVHSVDAYRLSRPEPQKDFVETAGVRRLPLASRSPLLATLLAHQTGGPGAYGARLRELLAPGRYDVIHFHNISLVGGPAVLALGDGIKLYTCHEYWLVCPTHVLFKFDREACVRKSCLACTLHARRPPQLWRSTDHLVRNLTHLDRLLVPSRFALERHRAEGIQVPMQALPSFVPVPASTCVSRTGAPYFLFVGRLEKLKGLQDLLPMLRGFPEARLRIAGTGAYEQELRSLAAGMRNVEFLGQVHPARVTELYADAIAVLVPSLCYEVFPLAPVEAMAHGVPVIARRLGALTEVVEDSGAGILFDTPEQCREAMEHVLRTPGMRTRLGERGRAMALAQWTEDVHMARYLELVAELQGERARGKSARVPAHANGALPRT